MASRTLQIDRTIDQIWPTLQKLETWEGIGGMHDLRNGAWDDEGELSRFGFSIETPLGDIRDDADVTSSRSGSNGEQTASLTAVADSKGIRVDVVLELSDHDGGAQAEFSINGKSTSFLTKPLVGALRNTLESGIDREGQRLVERLSTGSDTPPD